MEKTLIYVVRHGESIGNAKKIMLGHTNLDLSDHGYKQAQATCDCLASTKIDKVYSSDLLRAYNTAKPHADLRGLEVNADKGFRELYIGDWEGLSIDIVLEKWGDKFTNEWHGGFGTFKFINGEGVIEGGKRFHDTVMKVAKENRGKTILVAAHAAVIRSFWSIISGIAPEDIVEKLGWPTNASYSICELDGDTIRPLAYSCDDHLEAIGKTYVINPSDGKK